MPAVTNVVFLLALELHLLDLAGPAQVFSTANELGYRYDLAYVAEVEEITTAQGLPVRARLDWPELTPASGPITQRAERWRASARGRTRSAGQVCWTAGTTPPTTT
jgi:hypothetical protein